MDLGLQDRVVVVTGGTSGIGKSVCEMLLAEGANVATCGRSPERLDAVRDEFADHADRVLAARCDVRDQAEVDAFFGQVRERFGRIDGLVNNAGASRMKSLAEVTERDWVDELGLKFAGVLRPTLAALNLLRASPAASIVNMNAVLARQPETHLITTSAARAGVLNLSKSLAAEFAADDIRVNSVCLGLIDTGQWARRYATADTDLTFEQWGANLAADRGVLIGRFGRPEEVASAVLYLLSPQSSFITGTTIEVAGGVSRYV